MPNKSLSGTRFTCARWLVRFVKSPSGRIPAIRCADLIERPAVPDRQAHARNPRKWTAVKEPDILPPLRGVIDLARSDLRAVRMLCKQARRQMPRAVCDSVTRARPGRGGKSPARKLRERLFGRKRAKKRGKKHG
jgi:hypothetical protein